MQNTLDLPLKLPEPAVSPADVEQLVRVLEHAEQHQRPVEPGRKARAPGWLTAAEIASAMGDEATDRWVREVASVACPAVVSYPGSPGYKLWQLCSIDEISHCIEAIESQAKDMLRRAVMYRQAYYRRFRGAPGADLANFR